MAYINFDFIWSGEYARLEPTTKSVLFVIAGLANYETGEFYHSADTIAHKAGVSRASVYRAYKELLASGRLSTYPRPGKRAKHIYEPDKPRPDTRLTTETPPRSDSTSPGTPTSRTHETEVSHSYETGVSHSYETLTTDLQQQNTTTAANRISPSLIAEMTERFGAKRVLSVVVSMRSMDGEVKNANAYFRTCVTKGWIPTSEKARKKLEEQKRKAAAIEGRMQREKERQEWESQAEREAADPDIQARIQAEMAKIFASLEE